MRALPEYLLTIFHRHAVVAESGLLKIHFFGYGLIMYKTGRIRFNSANEI